MLQNFHKFTVAFKYSAYMCHMGTLTKVQLPKPEISIPYLTCPLYFLKSLRCCNIYKLCLHMPDKFTYRILTPSMFYTRDIQPSLRT